MDDCEHLQAQIDRLIAEVDELKSTLQSGPAVIVAPPKADNTGEDAKKEPSRRHMLRTLGVVSAGALAGSVLLEEKAAAADGNNVVAGQLVTAESATEIEFDGITDPGVSRLLGLSRR